MARWGFAFFDSGVRWSAPDPTHHPAMRDLTRFLENPFDSASISIAELFAFTTDHLGRMTANNASGELDARITATQSALDLLESCYTDDETKLSIRKARKKVKDDYRVTVRQEMARVEGAVVARYGPGCTQLLEIFKNGRNIFNTCRDDQVASQLNVIINGVTAYEADLGAALTAQVTAVRATWMGIYTASENSTASRTATREEKLHARENLQLMLFLNLLQIATMHPRQPEKLNLYMQQSLLKNPQSSGGGEEEPEPPEEPPAP